MSKQMCMHCYIEGRVQGVFFRASTKEEADRLDLSGWARNLPDGRVEVFACGNSEKLAILHEWLKHGPRLATVEKVTYEVLPWKSLVGFETR